MPITTGINEKKDHGEARRVTVFTSRDMSPDAVGSTLLFPYTKNNIYLKRTMTELITIYRDDDGMLRAKARKKNQLLAAFFETDVQEDGQMATELLGEVELLKQGKKKRFETSGNGHVIVITPRTATIESLFDEEASARRIKLDQFHSLLKDWLKAIN